MIPDDKRAWYEAEPSSQAATCGHSGGVGPWPARFPTPVGWMLSPELVGSLRAIFRQRLDPRRWMWLADGFAHLEDAGRPDEPRPAEPRPAEEPRERRRPPGYPGRFRPASEILAPASGEVWFDYAADLGDGFAAMYSTAYLLQADLALIDPGRARDALVDQHLGPDPDGGYPVTLAVVAPDAAAEAAGPGRPAAAPDRLPRGQFLFVGGDTAYHVADHATIVARVQAPMYWAARHLDDAGLLAAGDRSLYGIPGNHDWYDDLDGFSRIFRSGYGRDDDRAQTSKLARDRLDGARPIDLIGFRRRQHGSYLGIQLPWGWQLWGLDIDQRLDDRQRRYFESLKRDRDRAAEAAAAVAVAATEAANARAATRTQPPAAPVAAAAAHPFPPRAIDQARTVDKLILCTPSPAIVFHQVDATPAHDDALGALGLPRLYADAPTGVVATAAAAATAGQALANPQPPGRCRLDLSGDVHHYARYTGAWPGADRDPSFQSVVSGLGGAFLHATDTIHGARAPVVQFPAVDTARRACARGTHWWTLWVGGWMRMVPVLLCFGLTWVLLQDGIAPLLTDRVLAGLGIERPIPVSLEALVRTPPPDPGVVDVIAARAPLDRALGDVWAKMFVMLGGPALLIGAFVLGLRIARRHAREPGRKVTWADVRSPGGWRSLRDPSATFLGVTVLAGAGLAFMILGPIYLRHYPHDQTSDVLVLWLLACGPLLAGGATGWKLGAGRRLGAQLGAAVIATLHLAIQLATIVLAARLALGAWPWIAGASAVYLTINRFLTPWLVERDAPIWIVVPIWLALVAGFAVAIVHGTGGVVPDPRHWYQHVLVLAVATATATFVGCAHFGWYLAAMRRLMFHNNEIGGAAKVERFRQFIRFRVTPERITGYVIGLDQVIGPDQTGAALRPFLLDVFEVAPRPDPPPPAP